MKALILTCNTGQGHNSVTRAVAQAFSLHDVVCDSIDSLSFISESASQIIGNWHTWLYRYLPKVSDAGYKIAESHPELFKDKSIIRKFLVSGSSKLYDYIRAGNYDCIICPHVFSALMITQLIDDHPELKGIIRSCFIATDYTFAPITEETRCDLYFVPDEELVDLYSANGIPREKLRAITGIPVRPEFYKRVPKVEAKRKLGIPESSRHVVMMFGSMGCGPIPKLTSELKHTLGQNCILTVICGTNEMLRVILQFLYKDSWNIRIEGFVKDISLLMDSCDLYITKPGGLSISEARIKHLPMLLVNAVAGCEQNNLEFMLDKGAAVSAESEEDIAVLCARTVNDDAKLEAMSKAFDDSKVAAEEIYREMSLRCDK